jgi:hypothetical protein
MTEIAQKKAEFGADSSSETEKVSFRGVSLPFGIASIVWVVLGAAICGYFSESVELKKNMVWFFGLWTLCLCDLVVLGKAVQGMFAFAAGTVENRPAQVIQTFSWGFLKLICLGIFTLVMFKGRPFPMLGLLGGLGTLVVVPLLGGLLWSSKTLGVSENGRALV